MEQPYKVWLKVTEDERHSPFIVKGLLDLEREGMITLKIDPMDFHLSSRILTDGASLATHARSYPWCPELCIEESDTGNRKWIAIDLQDWSHIFSRYSLIHCEIIYKRAFDSGSVFINSCRGFSMIKPFGPNQYAEVKDARWNKALKWARILSRASKLVNEPLTALRRLPFKTGARHASTRQGAMREYTRTSLPEFPFVFFQVQYHDWGSSSQTTKLNEYRRELIIELKQSLGHCFVGGMFFACNEVPEGYEHCLTDVNPAKENYGRFAKAASVVVSTNGFGDSIPWKLMEYMEWGCCILSQRSVHAWRTSPKDAFMEFGTAEECVLMAEQLLREPEKIEEMKRLSAVFYSKELSPASAMRAVITDAFSYAL